MVRVMTIINTYDQCTAAGGDRIAICYYGSTHGRGSRGAHFQVIRYKDGQDIVTNPDAAFYDYGHKTFHVNELGKNRAANFWARKQQTLAEAVAWVKEKYGKADFVRNRSGDFVEREVNEKFPIPKPERKKCL